MEESDSQLETLVLNEIVVGVAAAELQKSEGMRSKIFPVVLSVH